MTLAVAKSLPRWVWALVWTAAGIYAVSVAGPALYAVGQRGASQYPPGAVGAVLGGGQLKNGLMGAGTRLRVAAGVALYRQGHVRSLLMSGDGSEPDAPPLSDQMAALARELGVPATAVRSEPSSTSTLQNALFSLELLDPDVPLVLITHGYHLPRAWASFRWAGARGPMALAPAEALAGTRPSLRPVWLLSEGVKWPVNLGRMALASGAVRLGVPRGVWVRFLG